MSETPFYFSERAFWSNKTAFWFPINAAFFISKQFYQSLYCKSNAFTLLISTRAYIVYLIDKIDKRAGFLETIQKGSILFALSNPFDFQHLEYFEKISYCRVQNAILFCHVMEISYLCRLKQSKKKGTNKRRKRIIVIRTQYFIRHKSVFAYT